MLYSLPAMEWKTSPDLVPYEDAVHWMEERVNAIRASDADEIVWLLEHPPLYTAGTSAKASDLLNAQFPVHQTGRGGQYTYHGPGQRVAYVLTDLQKRGGDVRRYVWNLEEWIIQTLAELGVRGERRDGRIGIWVEENNPRSSSPTDGSADNAVVESKIAAIGVRVRNGVTYHGVSLNVNPDLSHYAGIIPCGIDAYGVTSLEALDPAIKMQDADAALHKTFAVIF
jgi:lipoyl(octanoyl) transferase